MEGSLLENATLAGLSISTEEEHRQPLRMEYKAAITTFVTLFILFTSAGNLLTICVIKRDKRLRSISNMYLASLATADMIVGSFVMTFMLLYTVTFDGVWVFGEAFCHVWTFIDYVCCTASLTNVCLIARDRYLTVSQPLKAIRKRTKRRALYNIVVAWTIPIIFWATTILVLALTRGYEYRNSCQVVWRPTFVVLIASVSMTYTPIMIILLLFIAMMGFLRHHMRSMTTNMGRSDSCKRQQSFASVMSEEATSEKSGGISFNARYAAEAAYPLIDHETRKAGSVVFSNTSTESTETISTRSDFSTDILNSGTEVKRFVRSVATSTSPERYGLVRSVGTNTSPSLSSNLSKASMVSKASVHSDTTDVKVVQDSFARRTFRRLRSEGKLESDVDSSDTELLNIRLQAEKLRSLSLRSEANSQISRFSLDQGKMKWNRYASVLRAERQNSVEKSRIKQQVHAARTLGVIMGFLLICWIPFSIMCPLKAYCPECLSEWTYDLSIWINYMNSAINPIIYCLCNPQFRKAYMQLISKK